MKRAVILLAVVSVLLGSSLARALILPSNEGRWPTTWPKELEPLRKQSKTLGVATGTQENIYTILFETREDFEKYWPILMSLRTPRSPLTLSRVGTVEKGWGDLLSNASPCVRIRAPSGGYVGGTPKDGRLDLKELEAGTMLFAGAPWPKDMEGPNGELPEYVTSVRSPIGTLSWTSINAVPKKDLGFHHRARIDIELVIDGKIIDLNRIKLPTDAHLNDRRFPEAVAKP
jgi:hypothetical protein